MPGSINIFCAFTQDDKEFQDELVKYLNKKHIGEWHERQIETYNDKEDKIDEHLNISQIILLLISVDFASSKYFYGLEMQNVLERYEAGEALVMPIMVRPVIWAIAAFSTLPVLPTNKLPITDWPDTDQAFQDIALGIRQAMNKVLVRQYIASATSDIKNNLYESALATYQQAILLAPNQARAWRGRGQALMYLKRFDEALDAYEQAIRLEPHNPYFYKEQGDIFYHLSQWHEALVTYKKATRLKPDFGSAYLSQSRIHMLLAQQEEEKLPQRIEQLYKHNRATENLLQEE